MSVTQLSPTLQFTVNTADAKGKSFHASFVPQITSFADFQNLHFLPGQLGDATVSGRPPSL